MDSMITAAARALATGDPLGALNRVALRDDAPALALRGIAMAQLGDLDRAKALLKSAIGAFGPRETVARARCVVAEAEIALAARDLTWPVKALAAAGKTLAAHGDALNAAHARTLAIRRLLLIGRLDDAGTLLSEIDPATLAPPLRAAHELAAAGIAIRRLQTMKARAAFARAMEAARQARIPALIKEIEDAATVLEKPAARLIAGGAEQELLPDGVEALFAEPRLVIDACRHLVRRGEVGLSLATRPILFSLLRTLAEAFPGDASREKLLFNAFRARHADESHRARLRVEMGRLRTALEPLSGIEATKNGFMLLPRDGRSVAVLAPPRDEPYADVLALFADGEAWSSSALAIALGTSARTVQRALEGLSAAGKVQSIGRGRTRRWLTPTPGAFSTLLLLPGPLPGD
ncbi:helix-turn-helix domain-containing protein [Shinella sp. CPCC 101442]|uniref:helix-turn-helix domain-containing protein n=1 Tax=Shinella sp. CPCC 101442 TaxID=2932265 RepID=UPI00215321D1|nr:helix-turn-helix domain-containing protein [Shinella sp. CPCC 101442]MCR6500082.1 helix-turn-helix domain-containing protein [Shinella sp. CPCC 101442]